jgi:putative PIN family toxin of toxin-antitoxin system
MRIVLDTNVVISAFLSPAGHSGHILQAWRQQQFELVLSQELLNEYAEALAYDRINQRLKFLPAQLEEVIANLKNSSVFIEDVYSGIAIVADPDDNMLFSTALSGQAEFIISGDVKVQTVKEYQGIRVFSPAVFLALLKQ